jgi:hypothetical protein
MSASLCFSDAVVTGLFLSTGCVELVPGRLSVNSFSNALFCTLCTSSSKRLLTWPPVYLEYVLSMDNTLCE